MTTQPCMLAPRPHQTNSLDSRISSAPDTREKLAVMRRFESTSYAVQDYLPQRTESRYRQRRSTVEYLYQVVDFGGFQRHVVAYGMTHLMDRYLATCGGGQKALNDHNHYQLVALTCLYMAIKLLEPQNIGVDSLVPLSNGVYTREDFLQTERSILQALDWCVGQGPTPLGFVQLLMPLLASQMHHNNTTALYNHVQYQLELGVSDYNLCCAKPSDLAVAALWNGLESMDLSMKQQANCQRVVLDALQYDSQQCILLEYHLANLQAKLRHLTITAYSFTTSSAATESSNTPTKKNNLHQSSSSSPVSTVRKGCDDSPSTSGQDSIQDVIDVDSWLQFT